MNSRGNALALAVALNSGEETTLGPSDSALCAEALRCYAASQRMESISRSLRIPAICGAVVLVTVAFAFKAHTSLTAKDFWPHFALQPTSESVAFETFDELSKQGVTGQSVAPPVDLRSLATEERKG